MHERPHASRTAHPASPAKKAGRPHAAPDGPAASPGLWHGAGPALSLGVQRQAVIGAPDDAYEREAEAAAGRVVAGQPVPEVSRLPAGGLPTQRQAEAEEEEEAIQAWPVRRQPTEEEEETIQAQDAGGGPSRGGITPGMTQAATRAVRTRGPGTPMPPGTRHTLEARFGTDLSAVRLHTDPTAARHAEALHARAFTHGRHIWLGPGESPDDLALMAHETTHVLQQDGLVRRQPQEDEEAPAQSPARRPPGETAGAPTVALPAPEPAGARAAPGTPPTAEPATAQEATAQEAAAREGEPARTAAEPPADGAPPAPMVVAPVPGGDGAAPRADVELLMPEPPASLTEDEQARIAEVQQRAAEAAARAQALPTAEAATAEARAAVDEPERETRARAEAALVDALGQRPEPSPEIEALCERIYAVIRSRRPPDEESLVDANPEEMAREAGGQLEASVEGDARRVASAYDAMDEAPEGAPSQQAREMTPLPETVDAPAPGAERATPDPIPPENVSLEADVEASQHRMDEAGMTTEPASLVRSGPIAEARAAQGELEQTAAQGPAEVLAAQEATLAATRADMAALQAAALDALTTARRDTVRSNTGQQRGMVGSEAQMRERVSAEAERLFTDAREQVNRLLEPLPRTALSRWEAGVARLSTEFRQHLSRVERWIEERHAGLGGAIVGVWDAITGLPDWVVEEYDAAEQAFGDGVCALIREISTEVNGVIATCEAIIENARTRINELFEGLPADLQDWAAAEQARFDQRLDGLHERVRQTRDDFNRELTQRAAGAVQDVRQEIHALREAAGGLIGRIAGAIEAFLEDPVRFIIDGLLELVGIPPASFWALVNRIQQVLQDIADDPLGFAGNLLAAIGQGFTQFFDHIAGHLLDGLLDWLFSGLGSVGVEIPADFSLKSIITFFLQLMGITWERVRRLLARHIGEENVALIERAYEIVANLIELGPEGLFELLKEHLNPQNLLNMVLEAAVEFLVEALIRQVSARILMLFNPVGAILQAIEAIYRVLKWIFENAARLFTLVETVVNGIADILAGNIGGMARAVEQALARLIAPVIDFLAGYAGLGDLPEKIADVIRRMQNGVESILDRVIGFIAGQARRLLAAIGLGEDEAPVEEDDPEKAERIRAGLAAIDREEQRVLEGGKLSRHDAEQIAARVRQEHSVFTSITVIDGGDTWDYAYTASPERIKEGERKEEGETMPGSPAEFSEASLWEQVAAGVSASERGQVTRLSQRSRTYNLTVLRAFIDRSPATGAEKIAAHAAVNRFVAAAMAATDGDAIYTQLRHAARAVNRLYDQEVVQLQVHHEERVSQHPATFARTRAERIRARIRRRINNDVANLTQEERAIAAIPNQSRRNELIRLLAERMLEQDMEEGPDVLDEVEMDVLTREAHLGEVHGKRE